MSCIVQHRTSKLHIGEGYSNGRRETAFKLLIKRKGSVLSCRENSLCLHMEDHLLLKRKGLGPLPCWGSWGSKTFSKVQDRKSEYAQLYTHCTLSSAMLHVTTLFCLLFPSSPHYFQPQLPIMPSQSLRFHSPVCTHSQSCQLTLNMLVSLVSVEQKLNPWKSTLPASHQLPHCGDSSMCLQLYCFINYKLGTLAVKAPGEHTVLWDASQGCPWK